MICAFLGRVFSVTRLKRMLLSIFWVAAWGNFFWQGTILLKEVLFVGSRMLFFFLFYFKLTSFHPTFGQVKGKFKHHDS